MEKRETFLVQSRVVLFGGVPLDLRFLEKSLMQLILQLKFRKYRKKKKDTSTASTVLFTYQRTETNCCLVYETFLLNTIFGGFYPDCAPSSSGALF